MIPEPTILELLKTASTAVRGTCDKTADFIRGSDYEALNGPSAIIWVRQSRRDTDLFNAVNFDTVSGEELTDMAKLRYNKDRILDSHGVGTVVLKRATGGTAETIWKGTEFSIVGSKPLTYRVTEDTEAFTSTTRLVVPVEAVLLGTGVQADIRSIGAVRIDDPLEDSTWYVESLFCSDGTTFESAEAFKTRIRLERRQDRVGQSAALIQACEDAGADNVILFRSDYAGDDFDHGLNYCYVGDLGYVGTPELVKACTLALYSVRVAGDHLQVRPMAKASLDVSATLYLTDSPALFDTTRFQRVHAAAIQQYLNGSSGRFTYSLEGLQGALIRHTPEVQRVVLTTPTVDGTIVFDDLKNFPDTLTRYTAGRITLKYLGP